MRPIHWRPACLLAAAGLLAGCAAGAHASPPTWVPQPSVTLEAGPHVSLPNQPGPRPGPSGSSAPGSPPSADVAKPVPTVRTLTGLATSGDGGLLDLALSPTYADDGLIYAYVTTP
ncbi:MAG TPA: hypothetical protein VEL02_03510, partial [Jatrophihabitantaceae bacterium]|nr:hypothetical protein [Jatrophihabitantaceae bacterium]